MNIIRRLQLLFYILINICCLYHWILSQIIKVRNWEPMLVFQTTTIKINWKYSFLEKQLTMMTLAYLNCNNYNQSNWRFLLLESSSIRISFLLKNIIFALFPNWLYMFDNVGFFMENKLCCCRLQSIFFLLVP